MININDDLQTIRTAVGGETVRRAIANATETISDTKEADVTEELITIKTGRYGCDIRMAIHDALMKLANSSTPKEVFVFNAHVAFPVEPIFGTIIGNFEIVDNN